MTIGELKKALKDHADDLPAVVMANINGEDCELDIEDAEFDDGELKFVINTSV